MFILYQDNDLLMINKNPGEVVEGTSEELGMDSLETLVQKKFDSRARALHRLDKGTSGVLAFSLRRQHHAVLAQLWEKRQVRKVYWALVEGVWKPNRNLLESYDADSQLMRTKVKVLKSFEDHSFLELTLETGRKHQARKQCSEAGHPILGDTRYGAKSHPKFDPYFALHAYSLSFRHPVLGTNLNIEAETPLSWK